MLGTGNGAAVLRGALDFKVEIDLGAKAERDRIHRRQIGCVPVGAAADLLDGRLGGADQARDLGVLEFGMVAHQPEDGIGPVLALGHRGVARSLALGLGNPNLGFGEFQLEIGIGFRRRNLFAGQLSGGDRVEALDALRGLAIGDRLHLKRVKLAELRDLVEAQCSVVNEPDGGRLRHEKLLCHEYNPPVRPLRGRGPWMKPPFPGNRRRYNRKPAELQLSAHGFANRSNV